jgi:DNA-binding transcriptional ArsR family regulator
MTPQPGASYLTRQQCDLRTAARTADCCCGGWHGSGSESATAGVRGDFSLPVIQRRLYSSGMAVSTELDLGALARIGMALADATRRRVLVHLIGGTGYPAQMAEEFGTTRANLSNHLACLRECGLVTATAEGRRVVTRWPMTGWPMACASWRLSTCPVAMNEPGRITPRGSDRDARVDVGMRTLWLASLGLARLGRVLAGS